MTFDHERTETAVSTQAADSAVFAATEPAPAAAANQRDAPERHSVEPERLPRPGEVAEPAAIGPELTPDGKELDSIEFAGRSFKVPKALKPGLMMQADYTRKTQDVAGQGAGALTLAEASAATAGGRWRSERSPTAIDHDPHRPRREFGRQAPTEARPGPAGRSRVPRSG